MRVNIGTDLQAAVMGGDFVGDTGTATATSATTLTDSGKSWTVNALAGHVVVAGTVYGVILSNTATVITVDKWYAPATPGGAAGTTPGNVGYVILPGGQPAFFMALSTSATAPGATDTSLAGGELFNAGGGLNRAQCTYAHTAAATTFTLTKTFTANGSDGASNTIQKMGIFNSPINATGRLVFETAVPSPPVLVSGDQLTITETVTM